MNIVKGLITKEILNLKAYKKNFLLILLFVLVFGLFSEKNSMFITIYIPICFGMLAINGFYYDGISNAERYLLTLPLSRKEMVRSKYIYVLLVDLIAFILSVGFSSIVLYIKDSAAVDLIDIVSSTAGTSIAMLIVQILQIPILIKFGYEKGRYIQSLFFLLCLGIGAGFLMVGSRDSAVNMSGLVIWLEQYGVYLLTLLIIFGLLLSYHISCKIFQKKEI